MEHEEERGCGCEEKAKDKRSSDSCAERYVPSSTPELLAVIMALRVRENYRFD
jgi:hypothetical protein